MRSQTLRVLAAVACGAALVTPQMTASQGFADVEIQTVAVAPGLFMLRGRGGNIHCFHVESAHTDGDGIVHFRNVNALHMGDAYFNGRYPFIDTDSGGSIDGMIAAANRELVKGSLPSREPARGVRIQSTGMRGSSGRPRSTQASRPPESGRTRSMPRRRSRSATRALEASLGQVQ